MSVGQAFELAYKRHLAKSKKEPKENREVLDLKKQIESAKAENDQLKQRLEMQGTQPVPQNNNIPRETNPVQATLQTTPIQQVL